MIPRDITREHVLQAIEEIKLHDVASGRQSRKFLLRHDGKLYPPKYVVSLACELATGKALGPAEFGGGAETNAFLAGLGFDIVNQVGVVVVQRRPSAGAQQQGGASGSKQMGRRGALTRKGKRPVNVGSHTERCPVCKERIEQLLGCLYGLVQRSKSFHVLARPDGLPDSHRMPTLGRIYEKLTGLRGHRDFVRRKHLPPCDYFVPDPGFILEVDETQHFTAARRVSLEQYGTAVPVGFSVRRWIELCKRIDAHDNYPPDRDEQRAWYDTLRDFLPLLVDGLLPTVRLYAGERPWCKLDPGDAEDRALFRDWYGLPCSFAVKHRSVGEAEPYWGRVIICGPWYGGVIQARRLLDTVCEQWPNGVRTRILVTSGGFVSFEWPPSITRREVGDNRYPDGGAVAALFAEADRAVDALLAGDLRSKLRRCTDAITLGVDSFKTQVSVASERIRDLHAELVYFVDLRNNRVQRTGKIYPTVGQEDGLVRITDMDSRFATFDGDTVFLLRCHDLNAFNPRGTAGFDGAGGGTRSVSYTKP